MNGTGLAPDHASLVVHGPDRQGIVAAVAAVITRQRADIVSLDQHTDDPSGGAFFQRTVIHTPRLSAILPTLQEDLRTTVGKELGLEWTLRDLSVPLRVAVLASKSDHCLLDLLWRQRRGELPITVPMVVSNHADLAEDVHFFGVPFFHVPGAAGTDKSAVEARIVELLAGNVDLVVLARYMQVLLGSAGRSS